MITTSSKEPLVSIIVITYNSSKYVLETLESAKNQTYKNIELIISDDCSTDNTVNMCNHWLKTNKCFFVRTISITSYTNTGIAANCNRGLNASTGYWIKFIAGDDILINNCIENYVNYSNLNNDPFYFSFPIIKSEYENGKLEHDLSNHYRKFGPVFKMSARKQFKYLLIERIFVCPPTIFVNRETLIKLGGFDTKYKCEDLPLYLKATYNGFKFLLVLDETIVYRRHEDSQSNIQQFGLINEYWLKEHIKIKLGYFSFLEFITHPFIWIEFFIQSFSKMLIVYLGNKLGYRYLLIFLRCLSPIYFLKTLYKIKVHLNAK